MKNLNNIFSVLSFCIFWVPLILLSLPIAIEDMKEEKTGERDGTSHYYISDNGFKQL
jgi:hypothetical protein